MIPAAIEISVTHDRIIAAKAIARAWFGESRRPVRSFVSRISSPDACLEALARHLSRCYWRGERRGESRTGPGPAPGRDEATAPSERQLSVPPGVPSQEGRCGGGGGAAVCGPNVPGTSHQGFPP